MCPIGETIFDSVRLLSQPGCSSIQILIPHPSPYLAAGLYFPPCPTPHSLSYHMMIPTDTPAASCLVLRVPYAAVILVHPRDFLSSFPSFFQPRQSCMLIIRCDDNPSRWDAV